METAKKEFKMEKVTKVLDDAIRKLTELRDSVNKPIRTDIIVYDTIKIPLNDCFDKGSYWNIPRSYIDNHNQNGYALIPKSECQSLMDYISELEHYRDTTIGLYATDSPELIDDPQEVLFELIMHNKSAISSALGE